MFGNLFPTKTVRRKMKVSEAVVYLIREEQERLADSRLTRSTCSPTHLSVLHNVQVVTSCEQITHRVDNM